jgi:hypothetical protein
LLALSASRKGLTRRCDIWGIAEIDYANAEYVRDQRERERKEISIEVLTEREKQLPPSEPLKTLVARLRKPSPIALDLLVELFRPPKGYSEFMDLIREYLPDMEDEILTQPGIEDRMTTFGQAFSSRYFPILVDWLGADEEEDYFKVTRIVPVEFQDFTSYEYDDIPQEARAAIVVVACILENPFYSSDRAAFTEAAATHLNSKLLKSIPEEGFEFDVAKEAVKGTPFEPVIFWIDLLTRSTGNTFMDCSNNIEETGSEYRVAWNRPTIDGLTAEWQEYTAQIEVWNTFLNWFEEDIKKNTCDLIKILRERSNTDGENEEDKDTWPDPELNANQGRLFDILPDGTGMAGPSSPQDTTGQAPGPFGLL